MMITFAFLREKMTFPKWTITFPKWTIAAPFVIIWFY